MRHHACLPIVLMLLSCAALAAAPQTVTSGPWTITTGAAGPTAVSYQGQPLLGACHLTGFLPNWTGSRFSLSGGAVTATADSCTWSKQAPGNQEATLKVTAAGRKLTFTLDTTLYAAGPVEFAVVIVPPAVQTTEKYALVGVNGQPRTLDLVGTAASLSGVSELRFEQMERTVIVRAEAALLQDRRTRDGGLYLVTTLEGGGKTVTQQRRFEFEVQETRPEDRAARQATLSQVAMEKQEIPVPNGAFEEGLGRWGGNPRAAVDTEIKHGGKQAARITIPADQTDRTGIYLTQQVPVTGGRLYSTAGFLRSQDVKPVVLGDMTPTGVTLILEWADKAGKWLAAGDYATGLYGTKDWQPVSTKLMRAPRDAGFAVIFLALRGTGSGWFDDITLTEVVRHVVLQEPRFGQQVADNTPRFHWQYGEAGPGTLELSAEGTFPPAKTLRYADQAAPFSPDQPLAPGQWYWRASIPEHGASSVVWSFTQTAPLSQDCTPPQITPRHACLTSARQPVTVRYRDNVAVTQVELKLDGQVVPGRVSADSVRLIPARDWTPGLHQLQVTAADAAGNRGTRLIYLNYAPAVARKTWLPNGGIAVGGRPQFLLGMYGVLTEHLPEMKQAGYDFVHNYTWDGAGTNQSALEYLDACHKLGLQAFIGFDRSRLMAWDEEFVAQRVGALSRHPALLAWYLFDEPDLPHQYVPPDQLRALYRLLHELDPNHPVIVTVAQRHLMPLYRGSYDVYWSMDYGTPGANAANFEAHRAALPPGTPLMSIVHSYDGKQKQPDGEWKVENFQPGPQQLRACAFMALAHNSSGLCWWWWGQGSKIFMTVAHAPQAWAALQATVAQIRALRPVLEAQVEPRRWVEQPAAGQEVHLWEKKLPDRTVLIAVNREPTPLALTFASPAFRGQATARVLFEDRSVDLREGRLSDQFEGWGVHVYEVR